MEDELALPGDFSERPWHMPRSWVSVGHRGGYAEAKRIEQVASAE
jgi:hypothetical protein